MRCIFALLHVASFLKGQEVVDRIVARVENDIILQSDVQELKEYQELVDGKSESESAILDRLIDQWIVRSEAELSRFPEPKERRNRRRRDASGEVVCIGRGI